MQLSSERVRFITRSFYELGNLHGPRAPTPP